MLAAYRARRWEEATAGVRECRCRASDLPLEELYRLHERRIAAFRAAPPPPDWDGVHVAAGG
jgi:adenylate cyclase